MRKNQIAFNRQQVIWFLIFFEFIAITVKCMLEKEILLAVLSGLFVFAGAFVILTQPLYFVFSEEQVEIVYLLLRMRIRWDSVRNIWLEGDNFGVAGNWPRYVIAYPQTKKLPFFALGEIPKTSRTKKLMEMYYKKEIKG